MSRPQSSNQSNIEKNDAHHPADNPVEKDSFDDTISFASYTKNSVEPTYFDSPNNCDKKGNLTLSVSTNIEMSLGKKNEWVSLAAQNNINAVTTITTPDTNDMGKSILPPNSMNTEAMTAPNDIGSRTSRNNSNVDTLTSPNNWDIGTSILPHDKNTDTSTSSNNNIVTTSHAETATSYPMVSPNNNLFGRALIATNNLTLTNLSEIEKLINDTEMKSPTNIVENETITIASGINSDDTNASALINNINFTVPNENNDSGHLSLFNNSSDSNYMLPNHFGGPSSQFSENMNETRELCNFHSLMNFLGDAMNHVKGILSEQYRSFVQECMEYNNPSTSGNRSESFPSEHTEEENLRHDRELESINDWIHVMTKKVAELEHNSIDSFKCSQLLMRNIHNLQNELNHMKAQLQAQNQTNASKQHAIISYLQQIISHQARIKQDQDQITKSLQVIKTNQESMIKAQMIISERYNNNMNRPNENERNNNNNDEAGRSSRPNLSYYNFHCALSNVNKLNGMSNNSNPTFFEILNSEDSFISTTDIPSGRDTNVNSEVEAIESILKREESKVINETEYDFMRDK